MGDGQADRTGLAGPGVILAAAALGGFLLLDLPVGSLRPEPPPLLAPGSSSANEDVDARLWADPLAIVTDHEDTEGDGLDLDAVRSRHRHSLQHLASVIHDRRVVPPLEEPARPWRRTEDPGEVLLLGVMIPGGPWAEDAEIRRRSRQAVVLGLAEHGLVPRASTKLGYIEVSFDRHGCLDGEFGGSAVFPFEEFRRSALDRGAAHRVFVLWLREDALERNPPLQLKELFAHLLGFRPWGPPPQEAKARPARVAVIGPATSDMLLEMSTADKGAKCSRPELGDPNRVADRLARSLEVIAGDYLTVPLDEATSQNVRAAACEVLGERFRRSDDGPDRALAEVQAVFRDKTRKRGDQDLHWRQRAFATWAEEAISVLGGRMDPDESEITIPLFSARATAVPLRWPSSWLEARLGERQLELVSVILKDDRVAGALVDELGRRGVDVACRSDDGQCADAPNIVLISEADTLYGSALPSAVAAHIACRRANRTDARECWAWCRKNEELCAHPAGVERFSYLRGLDGKGPRQLHRGSRESAGGEGKRGAQSEAPPAAHEAGSDPGVERAVGAQQIDHLRRLANSLKTREGRIQAIGVLGSDLYDKQVVLQALRRRFKEAVFFTTDLDARLLHPDAYDWSRNLVVATSYGLSLLPELQGEVPPFRGVYQTATFLAARLAAGPVNMDERCPCVLSSVSLAELPPLLFEVARSGAYPLTPVSAGAHLDPSPSWELPVSPWKLLLAVIVGGGLVGFLTLGRLVGGVRRLAGPERIVLGSLLVAGFIALAALLVLMQGDMNSHGGEPVEFWEGVSVWPSLLIQLLAVVLGLWLLFRALHRLAENADDLTQEYELDHAAGPPGFWRLAFGRDPIPPSALPAEDDVLAEALQRSRMRRILHACRRVTIGAAALSPAAPREPMHPGPGAERGVDIREVWREYLYLGARGNRLARVVPATGFFLMFAWALFLALDPSRTLAFDPLIPVRGEAASSAEPWLFLSAFSTLYLLTFFTLDASRLCAQWIGQLADEGPGIDWGSAGKAAGEHLGGRPEDVQPLLDVELVARRSAVVSELVLYPFVVLALVLLARLHYFDYWAWPTSLWVVLGIVSAIAVGAGVAVRNAAERARGAALERLARSELVVLGAGGPDAEQEALRIRRLADRVRGIRTGAFAPWSRHPILKALMLPLTAGGTVTVLNLLAVLAP